MKKLYPVFVLAVLCILFDVSAYAQDYWQKRTENSANRIPTDKSVTRLSFPTDFKLFELNIIPLRNELFTVVGNKTSKHSTVISLPNPAGDIEQFEVFEASNFESALQARFPEIRCFSGKSVTDPSATLKLSIAPGEISTMVFRAGKPAEFIEAYSKDHTVYASYVSQRQKGKLPWTCSTDDTQLASSVNSVIGGAAVNRSSAGQLKTMRLAQSCNGEYAAYFGASTAGTSADSAKVYAAFNVTLSRCNGIYEKDLALHLNLIANTGRVIYFNGATDPYSPTIGPWNQELQTALTNNIGNAGYDIGHMFGASGGGGNAGCIGCVCVNPTGPVPLGKGAGITSPQDGIPKGDNFDIDYVAHEVGHQLGANHTFSHGIEGTGTNNKEVGSGITIMGYAGITFNDVTDHSIAIFHQNSIVQVQANLNTKTCPITTSLAGTNATPVVSAQANYSIPKSTPFALTGVATDANPGDVLTYCWEQNNSASTATDAAQSTASITKTAGPNFISWMPTVSPTRFFPKLSQILRGFDTTQQVRGDAGMVSEALSSVARTLNFRLTVRDNCPYSSSAPVTVGQTQFTDMAVTVVNTAAAFALTVPNTNVSYPANSTQTVTWSFAGSNVAPINCANVRILYSSDGGQTFPTELLATTLNDGTQAVTIPAAATTTARIKVESIGNIFFDISNTDFTVTVPPPVIYTFIGTGNWNVAANWSGITIPPATLPSGAQIIINHTVGGVCSLNVTQTIATGGILTINTGKNLLIPGTLIRN